MPHNPGWTNGFSAADGFRDLNAALDSMRSRAGKLRLPYGTLYVTGRGDVDGWRGTLIGRGGGYCWSGVLRRNQVKGRLKCALTHRNADGAEVIDARNMPSV